MKDYNKKPYKEITENNIIRRSFSNDINEKSLTWHRDKKDRVIIVLENNDWMIQFDNEIPKKLNVNEELFIPKETFHRVIKGTGDLKLEIIETEFEPNDYAIVEVIEEGNKKKKKTKKDACYYKVKSRYDVWPSAYSSGSLVRCRKVGAANWGNKSNESMDDSNNTVIKKIKSYRIPFKEFNQKMKTDWIPMWKEEYENDLAIINEMVARHLLYKIAEDLVGGVNEINFKNESKKPTNHFQMEMYLGEIILFTGPFIYVDDKHHVIAKRTKIEVLNSDYDDIAVLKENYSDERYTKELIDMAHKAITRIKGKDYAPDVHEIQTWINDYLKKTDGVNETNEPIDITEDANAVNEVSDFMHYMVKYQYNNERIVMSHEDKINFKPTPIDKQKVGPKPRGFWYGFGSSWLDFVRSGEPDWETNYVHLVKVNDSKILKISTFDELSAFTEEFGVESEDASYMQTPYINWPEVAKLYSGIEINPYIIQGRRKFDWYYPWDVASGCVWGEDSIVSIELLDEVEIEREYDEASKLEEQTDFSKEKEEGLHGWFARQGGKGKSKGWVDCNTCKKDPETGRKKCKSCGRKEGESRAKYPACRPTPSACGTRGKGKKWGKKTKLDEKLVLSNYSDYAKIVAEAYDSATNFDESVVPSYISLIDSAKKLYKQLLSRVKVEFVDYEPYENKDEMIKDFKENGVLKISSLFNEHPLFSKEDNLKFRAVHDYYTHIIANQEFGLRGELKAYNTHAKLAPPSALPALFTEVVGQACYKIVYGDFPTQKICELHGFDYKNVGKIDDIDIINKQLDVDNNKSKSIYKNMGNVKQKLDEMISNHSKESNNYMFWQNLKTMYHAVSEMKEMDFDSVDSMLSDGHGWALDHIATSKDDVEEVYHFLKNKINYGMIDKNYIQKQLNEAFMDDEDEKKPTKLSKTKHNDVDKKPLNIRRENKPFLPIIEK